MQKSGEFIYKQLKRQRKQLSYRWKVNVEVSLRTGKVLLNWILLNVIHNNVIECISSWNKVDQKHIKSHGYGFSALRTYFNIPSFICNKFWSNTLLNKKYLHRVGRLHCQTCLERNNRIQFIILISKTALNETPLMGKKKVLKS